jgi:recombination protein RecT
VTASALDRIAEQQQPSLVQFLTQIQPEIERALPRGMNADRMARIVLTEMRKTPKLNDSTLASFAGAILTAAQLGLEIGGATGEGYLIPYEHKRGPLAGKTECQLVVGYQGIVSLFYRHPLAQNIDAQAVYEADEFEWSKGTDAFLRHKPARGDRGRVIEFYGVASLSTGAKHFEVLTPEQVRTLRSGKVGPKGDIADPMLWMERKTVLKQTLKLMPKRAELAQAIAADENTLHAERQNDGRWAIAAEPAHDPDTAELVDTPGEQA